ncbi:excinuclease ABC subunit UvrB [Candidatus Gracilibacteria bacterium]|nr:excinuclease ABC subunit UvrB [Candidatus Gracilibacteria bacterium]
MQELKFQLKSKYQPAGDQGSAIEALTKYIDEGHKWQTLWGVTGSGKTFTMANIIEQVQKPTLIVAHNKTLAAQLAQEFKEFFPDAAVHYFVSYYDYYQPEAYVKKTDTYIEKEATINEEIDRLRHAATQSLMTRKDVIIVASVSCIYGIGDISAYTEQVFQLKKGWTYVLEELLKNLVNIQFTRATSDFKSGNFIVQGDILEIWPASSEYCYVIEFWGDEITQITTRHPLSNEILEYHDVIEIFPAKHTVSSKDTINAIIPEIQAELTERLTYLEAQGDVLKYERLKTKVEYDIEMLQEVGYVNGIENYSRFLDGRETGRPPATLIDYFGDDFITFIDESHMTIPQIGGMYAGDRSRKENLVENGFRLPSAMDNRPLRFPEFEAKLRQVVAVSATPGKYEIEASAGGGEIFFNFDPTAGVLWEHSSEVRIVPQMIRPTGLLDPEVEILAMQYMIDDIIETIDFCVGRNERMLITTLTKRSSEELTEYLIENGVKVQYLHSEVDTLERLEILKSLREGKIDVIVGVNLLREGLDLPEVSRIAILDADKQGFLRSEQALIQIIGRAARNQNGKVKMYVEKHKTLPEELIEVSNLFGKKLYFFNKGKYVTDEGYIISSSMKKAMDLTYYRRGLQIEHNKKIGMTPSTIISSIKDIGIPSKKEKLKLRDGVSVEQEIRRLELEMDIAAANMEYEKAAEIRDTILEFKAGKNKKRRG